MTMRLLNLVNEIPQTDGVQHIKLPGHHTLAQAFRSERERLGATTANVDMSPFGDKARGNRQTNPFTTTGNQPHLSCKPAHLKLPLYVKNKQSNCAYRKYIQFY